MTTKRLILMYMEQDVLKVRIPPEEVFFTVPMVAGTGPRGSLVFGHEALASDERWPLHWLQGNKKQEKYFKPFFRFVFEHPIVWNNAGRCTDVMVAFEPVLIPESNGRPGYFDFLDAKSFFPNYILEVGSRGISYLSLFGRKLQGVRFGLSITGEYTRIRSCKSINAFGLNNVYTEVGFETIVNLFIKLLCEKGYDFTAAKNRLLCNKLVMDYCYVALDFEKELERIENLDGPLHVVTMENGTVLELGKECIIAPEVLFNPGLVGMDKGSIMSLFQKYNFTDQSVFPTLILSGGNALGLTGLGERIQREIMNSTNTDLQFNIIRSKVEEDALRFFEWQTNSCY